LEAAPPRFIVAVQFHLVLGHQPDVTAFELVETFLVAHFPFFAAGFRLDAGRFAT
jgi:hypothetical protein